MIRNSVAAAAALSLGFATVASAAAPVRPGSARVAAKPLTSMAAGDRVGAEAPGDASALVGSTLVVVIVLLLLAGGAAVVIGGSESSPR